MKEITQIKMLTKIKINMWFRLSGCLVGLGGLGKLERIFNLENSNAQSRQIYVRLIVWVRMK